MIEQFRANGGRMGFGGPMSMLLLTHDRRQEWTHLH